MKLFNIVIILLLVPLFANAQKASKQGGRSPEKELKAEAVFTDGMRLYIAEKYVDAVAFFNKSIEILPTAGANYMLAKLYEQTGDIPNAALHGENAMKMDIENKYYQKIVADIYNKQHRLDEAITIYKNLANKYPDDNENYFELANVYIKQEKYSEAIETYDKIEKNIGINDKITHQKQLLLLKQNKVDKAIEEGGKLIAAEPKEPEYIIQQVKILVLNQRLTEAILLLEKAMQTNPDFADSYMYLAEIYQEQNQPEKCLQVLELAFKNPNIASSAKYQLLSIYMKSVKADKEHNIEERLINLTQSLIKAAPKEAKGYVIMGDLLMQKGEPAAARDNYVKALRYDKSVFEVWLATVELDSKLNQIDSLVKHTEEAIEYFPNQPFLWYNNGLGNYLLKKYEKSIASLEEARRLTVDNQALAQHINSLLGDEYNQTKQFDKSDQAYEEVLKDDADNEYVLNNYSYYLSLRKDKLDKALELSAKLIKKFPENSSYLDTHAWVLYMMKNYAKAQDFLLKAVNQKNPNGLIVEHYGDVLYQLGDKNKAIEQWNKAKLIGGTSVLLDKKITLGLLLE